MGRVRYLIIQTYSICLVDLRKYDDWLIDTLQLTESLTNHWSNELPLTLTGWPLAHWLTGWQLAHWLTGWHTDVLTGWYTDVLTDWHADLLMC